MTRKPCQHGVSLAKGLRCDKGYAQVFLHVKGKVYCKNFGLHTKFSQEIAEIHLAEKRKEILLGKFGMTPELKQKKFNEVMDIWFAIWAKQLTPEGKIKHNEESCYKVRWTLERELKVYFGELWFDEITSVHIQAWRDRRVSGVRDPKDKTKWLIKPISGTTVNRYQAILRAIFSHTDRWIKTEKIKQPFKVPVVNPCIAVEMASTKKRKRILDKYEAKKLKWSFAQLQDNDGWEICKLALRSVLSLKDLKGLEIGQEIDIERTKTGVPVNLPITILVKLNFYGWRTRWEKARSLAGLQDVQFRDLRKTGINWLKGRHELKLISEYAGHADISTTEAAYTIKQAEYLEPLAKDLEKQVNEL